MWDRTGPAIAPAIPEAWGRADRLRFELVSWGYVGGSSFLEGAVFVALKELPQEDCDLYVSTSWELPGKSCKP